MLAGGIYLLVENTSAVDSLLPSGSGERPEMIEGEMPARPEGGDDHHAASFLQGMVGVGQSLAKIGVITLVIFLVQKALDLVKKQRRLKPILE